MVCPNCQSENRDSAKFCDNCGTTLHLNCLNCGTANRPGAKFCDNCGHTLKSVAKSGIAQPATIPQPALVDQFIPPELAAKLETARRSGTMAGERRIVTMLFCDVVGSTAASEQLDPEEWIEIMNGAFEHMIKPIYRFEGTVARLMGDAILAFFGAPIAHEDDPRRAVLAGLEIVNGIQQYRQEVKSEWGIALNVRVGINTGLVVVGAVGSDLRLEYTAMGDAINLAARMEQTAEPGTVQIAEDTYRLVAPLFETEPLGGIKVKGKTELVLSYRVLGRKAMPDRLRGIEGLEAPLVGRSNEWERLQEVVDNLERGIGGIVCLLGEAGLGKSRLVQELRGDIENRQTNIAWHETASLSYETDRPYALFQRMVRRLVGARNGDPSSVLRNKLQAIIRDTPDEEQAEGWPVFDTLFGLARPDGQLPLEGAAFKGRLFTMMERSWSHQAGQRPTVLVFDDLHWSDPASVALLLHLLPLTEQVPLLILAVMRPENQAPGWQVKQAAESGYGYRYNEIFLQPLSEADSSELVDNLLAISDLPDPLRSRILQKSEGNPFFVEEVVRTLIESGAVARDETGWHWEATAADETIEIPGNVQTLLTARIDRLGVETRGTLQLASVIGRYFYRRVLARIANQGADLDDQLLILQGTQLIKETSRLPELEYIFRHALTQEAAYSTILLRQRRRFHAQVGEVLESLFPDQHEALAGSLARHFFLAQDYGRALHHYTVAGDAAFRQFAAAEAIDHYGKAIECTGKVEEITSDQLVHLFARRGRVYELDNQFEAAVDNYRHMIELSRERGDKALLLSSLISQCIVHGTHTPFYDPTKAEGLGEEALQLARELGDRAAEARVLWALLVAVDKGGGDKQRALAYGQESLAISHELGLTEQIGQANHDLANLYLNFDRYKEAQQSALNARTAWLELNITPMLADSYVVTATVHQFAGEYEAAIADAQEMLRIGQSIGNLWTQTIACFYASNSFFEQGNFERAFDNLHLGLNLAEKAGIVAFTDIAKGNLILHYLASGAQELAEPLAEEIYTNRDRLVFGFSSSILSNIAHLKLMMGDLQRAEQIVNEAYPDPDTGELLLYVAASIHMVEALIHIVKDHPEQALESLGDLVERARRIGAHHYLPEPLLIQGKALAAMENHDQAGEVLREARAVAAKIGQRRVLWQILAVLAELEEKQGNSDKAKTYRIEARIIVDYIVDHSGSELRSSFLSMPEVEGILDV